VVEVAGAVVGAATTVRAVMDGGATGATELVVVVGSYAGTS